MIALRNTRYLLLLAVFTAPGSFAEELPAMTMTGMRTKPITQTTAAMAMTGMAITTPTAIKVSPPTPGKK